jgi:hypothetical protein
MLSKRLLFASFENSSSRLPRNGKLDAPEQQRVQKKPARVE